MSYLKDWKFRINAKNNIRYFFSRNFLSRLFAKERHRFEQFSPPINNSERERERREKMAEGGAEWEQHRYKFEDEKRVVWSRVPPCPRV